MRAVSGKLPILVRTDGVFYEARFRAFNDKNAKEFLIRGSRIIKREIQTLLSVNYPPPSRPGRPPHRRTGSLHDSISVVKPEKHVRDIGPRQGLPYPDYVAVNLEFGRKKMAPRPFMRPGVKRALPKLKQLAKNFGVRI